jgi:hypothetical protein
VKEITACLPGGTSRITLVLPKVNLSFTMNLR